MKQAMPIRPHAFSLVELIVVLAVIALLISLLLPAIQRVRQTARMTACRSHLRQIGVAVHNYIDVHKRFPGGPHQRGLFMHYSRMLKSRQFMNGLNRSMIIL